MTVNDAITLHRNEWIVYANQVLLMSVDEIAEKVKLAYSTIKKYIHKFSGLLEQAQEIFDKFYFKSKRRNYNNIIDPNGLDIKSKGGQKCYLFRFYDANGNLVCSKVGTTTRSVSERLKEELRSKTYADCKNAVVDRVYNCGEIPAEGLESFIRAEYIKRYPDSFQKNDRFMHLEFDLPFVDSLVKSYFA